MKIDRDTVRLIREELAKKLDELEAKFQMQCTVGSASFSESNVTFKVEFATITKDGTVLSREAESFKSHAIFFGLKATDLGRTFRMMGHDYVIAGMMPKSRQYPIIGERKDGKRFKFDVETVKRTLLPLS